MIELKMVKKFKKDNKSLTFHYENCKKEIGLLVGHEIYPWDKLELGCVPVCLFGCLIEPKQVAFFCVIIIFLSEKSLLVSFQLD